ncbi:winged helix-turn-helix domain-containing protein [Halomicroarcula sp. F13]|uniref:Winged helix-turn-helix domain-containing protein n=1 Tax=Haloarcula rubra TaxID=2487747 RepID=A0AAW4PVI3_9EURY|nr:winged helix-turn-helix domain-containing protein [Halomicroarcula rubra]MBX0324545.1 winged helix-turn-helix domain-containing protein [Halomicroarcula rubra]
MTPADQSMAETLATDGGMRAEQLADATDTSQSTVYRMLQRLEGIVTSDDGHVRSTFRVSSSCSRRDSIHTHRPL